MPDWFWFATGGFSYFGPASSLDLTFSSGGLAYLGTSPAD